MIITKDWIMSNRTKKGAWTRSQIQALDIEWPPSKGWIDRIVGSEITRGNQYQFEAKWTVKDIKRMEKQ
jgi:hypothetical protein